MPVAADPVGIPVLVVVTSNDPPQFWYGPPREAPEPDLSTCA